MRIKFKVSLAPIYFLEITEFVKIGTKHLYSFQFFYVAFTILSSIIFFQFSLCVAEHITRLFINLTVIDFFISLILLLNNLSQLKLIFFYILLLLFFHIIFSSHMFSSEYIFIKHIKWHRPRGFTHAQAK